MFCNGRSGPVDCSVLWYPDSLKEVRLVTFQGSSYACELFGDRCVSYDGGPLPTAFFAPDIWCDPQGCSYYDPANWFEIHDDQTRYYCQNAVGPQQYDCVEAVGTRPPMTIAAPDLYCSGQKTFPDCSDLWYPSVLSSYNVVNISGFTYLCNSANGPGAAFGDYDCGYLGGNPSLVFTSGLKCSQLPTGFDCGTDDYPSALIDVFFSTIDGWTQACRTTGLGSECFRYYGRPIRTTMIGLPDYYCNAAGVCDKFAYP